MNKLSFYRLFTSHDKPCMVPLKRVENPNHVNHIEIAWELWQECQQQGLKLDALVLNCSLNTSTVYTLDSFRQSGHAR